MLVLKLIGVLLFISGVIFCITPKVIVRLNQWGKRLIFSDEGAIKHNIKTGIILMLVGLIIFFINWYYGARF